MSRVTTCPRCWGMRADPEAKDGRLCRLCDGSTLVEDVEISPHFTFSELVTTRHHGFPNDPSQLVIENARALAKELLEPLRAEIGAPLTVTSWFRERLLDAHVSGDSERLTRPGAHQTGFAADVVPVGISLHDAMATVETMGLWLDQAILEGGCLHLALCAPDARHSRRGQLLVRMVGAGERRWTYSRFDGSEKQRALIA